MKEIERLVKAADTLIDHEVAYPYAKWNLKRNIRIFMEQIEEKYVVDCKWELLNEGDDRYELDLIWEWKDVCGVFGFCADNGHSFYFELGEKTSWSGGDDGDHGFSCGLFVHDLEQSLSEMGY